MSQLDLSEQEIIRRNSLNELRNLGIDPYPAQEYVVNAYTNEIKESFVDGAERRQVSIAGRIMTRRVMGKASFLELKDAEGAPVDDPIRQGLGRIGQQQTLAVGDVAQGTYHRAGGPEHRIAVLVVLEVEQEGFQMLGFYLP